MNDVIEQLKHMGDRYSVPCPDGLKGCIVSHFKFVPHPTALAAIEEIERLRAENARLREALFQIAHQRYGAALNAIDNYNELQAIARAALAEKGEK